MEIKCNGKVIGEDEIEIMSKTTIAVFEVLEKYWASRDCALIDMKIEFGVGSDSDGTNTETCIPFLRSSSFLKSLSFSGEILLADVIDSDSWRLWPSGDKRLMKDKQVYRDMADVTGEGLQQVKRNFQWVSDQLDHLTPLPRGRVVIIMGSAADKAHCEEIEAGLRLFGVPCVMRVCSAHKSTDKALQILAQYEGTF